MNDIEKNYRNTLSKTHLRSDRGDLGLRTFAGSGLHGGTPPAEKLSAPKTTHDLYAPLNTAGYGPGYYDSLRATSPVRYRPSARPNYSDEPEFKSSFVPSNYQTNPTRISTDFDLDNDLRKTTKTTKTTEFWVPLTTHIYNTPYHTYYYRGSPFTSHTYRTADDLYSYNYVDDFKRYATTSTTTRSKNIDALDLSITSKNYEKADYSQHYEKCRKIQEQLDEVSKWVYEAETKLKSDLLTSKSRMETDLLEVALIVDDTAKYNEDLHRVIKKQAKQISSLSSKCDRVNKNIEDIADTLEKSRVRCLSMQSDLTSVQSGLELAMKRR